MVHSRLTVGSVKENGLPVRQCDSEVELREVSSESSRHAASRGDSLESMLPEIGARWWL